MSPVGELSVTKAAPELQSAAMVGDSQSIPFHRELRRVPSLPVLSKNLPTVR